ncbi:MAG TPA: GNAT family N-acetyltransferase [Ktedonobacterales bacterium]|nr:GNAT family N-acetyltransferase [Ktedonobacterales bacterium]
MGTFTPRTITLKSGVVVRLRAATAADAPALMALMAAETAESVYGVMELDELNRDEARERQRIQRFTDDANNVLLIAEADGAVVGALDFTTAPLKRMRHVGRLGISVAAAWRERGVGRALLVALLEWARAHPTIEKVTLGVLSTNARAIHLYEALGFVEEGRQVRAFRLGPGEYVDDVQLYQFVK